MPVPGGRENLADGHETAHGFIGSGGGSSHQPEVPQITCDGIPGKSAARGNALGQVVRAVLDGNVAGIHTQHTQRIYLKGHGQAVSGTDHRNGKGLAGMGPEHLLGVLQVRRFHSVHGHNLVSLDQPGPRIAGSGHDAVNHKGKGYVKHAGRIDYGSHQGLVHVKRKGIGPAEHLHLPHLTAGQIGLQIEEIRRLVVVVTEDAVSRPEAQLLSQLIDIYGAVVGDVVVSPDGQDGTEQNDGQQEVVEYAAGHHEKPLPGGFGAELPGLRVFLELLRIHGFVHHAGNLAVAAQGQPAYAVLGFPVGGLGAQFHEPRHAGGEQFGAANVEEQEELVHPDMEHAGPKEVPRLVDEDEHRQSQDNLEGFHKYHHRADILL